MAENDGWGDEVSPEDPALPDGETGEPPQSREQVTEVPIPPPLPDGYRRPGAWDLLALLGIVWTVEIGLGIAIVAMVVVQGGLDSLRQGFSPEAWHVVVVTPFSVLCTVTACWYFACKKYGRSFRDGLYLNSVSWPALRSGVLCGLAGAVIGGILMMFFSTGESMIQDLVVQPDSSNGGQIALPYALLGIFVLMPFLEELYYRGFIYSVLDKLMGARWAFALVVLWFGLVHTPQLMGDPVGIPVVTAMGAVFTWLRYKHDSIIPAMASHFTYNGILVAVSLVQVAMLNR